MNASPVPRGGGIAVAVSVVLYAVRGARRPPAGHDPHDPEDLLAERYASDLYQYNVGKYKTAECRDGGSLDLHPASDVWP